MTASTRAGIARADVVGSLLRPDYLREARRAVREGKATETDLLAAEDRAVREAIALQESAGLDVITDGELRRTTWIATADPLTNRAPVTGYSTREDPEAWRWTAKWRGGSSPPFGRDITRGTFITERLRVVRDLAQTEYAFLKANAHVRTKFTIPAPSWHRVYWHPRYSSEAYPTVEDYLHDVRGYLRSVVEQVIALGCDYVQLDAPHYAMFHCDPAVREMFTAQGRDLDAELVMDVEIDNSVFDGITGITRAMHICRGNNSGNWVASGGYGAIADVMFPRLTNIDTLLLEYDTPRAGDFSPLRQVRPDTVVVLGLLTTKSGVLEDADNVETRIREAATLLPLERLALSPQCGFASVAQGNPLTPAEQEAKLRLVGRVAHKVWPR